VVYTIATDWVINGCLKWCLMYSRISENIVPILHKAWARRALASHTEGVAGLK
jgi:hypothetical protein